MFDVLKGYGYTVEGLMRDVGVVRNLKNMYALINCFKVAQPCTSMLKKCYWKNKEMSCNTLFKFVKVSSGFCCSFNYFGSKKIQ